jgi:hypothetical protein
MLCKYTPAHVQLRLSSSINFLNHLAPKRHPGLGCWGGVSDKETASRCLEPLVRHAQLGALLVLHIAHEYRGRPLGLLVLFLGALGDFQGATAAFRGLFVEEAVDSAFLEGIRRLHRM